MTATVSRALLALLLAAAPLAGAPAQADERADLAKVRKCLSGKAGDEAACIGTLSGPCMEQPDGQSTMGMSECLDREQAAWDTILKERYAEAVADAKESDAALVGSLAAPDPLSVLESLKKAQRAWIAFRDAECDRLWANFQEGTIRTNIYSSCSLDMTARRAIELVPDNEG